MATEAPRKVCAVAVGKPGKQAGCTVEVVARLSQNTGAEEPMTEAIQIVFRDLPPSASLEGSIRRKAERLLRLHEGITTCRVTVARPPAHHHKGGHYQVRIDLHIPGAELVAAREPNADNGHDNPYVAARDAFRATKRMLQEHLRRQRDSVRHERITQSLVALPEVA